MDPEGIRYALAAYFIFGLLWLIALVNAIAWTSMSGAVSQWFFYRDDPSERSCFPVFSALYRTLRFHLGSLALGSLCVAVVQVTEM